MVGSVATEATLAALEMVDEMRTRRVDKFVWEPDTGYLNVTFLPPLPPPLPKDKPSRPLVDGEREELDQLRVAVRREEEALSAS